MLDLVAHLIVWCQSCAPDAQSVAPAVGIIGGAAGAVGAIGGLASGAANSATSGAVSSGSTLPAELSTNADANASSGGDGSANDDVASPAGDDGASSGGSAGSSPFTDTTGGFKMHEAPDPPAYPGRSVSFAIGRSAADLQRRRPSRRLDDSERSDDGNGLHQSRRHADGIHASRDRPRAA